jgi:glycerol-3-phosphate O-acyltransferase / dihydroxyacetone phosphate acyltransferase
MQGKRQFRLSPILWFIYHFVRNLAWVSTRVFYKNKIIIGKENLKIEGAAIVISNHPSTLLDVFNVGPEIHRNMFFLANYGLFKHPVSRWVFSRLYCIPVKRKEDVGEGEARDNDAAFAASFEHLAKGGILFIAPEGVSFMNRWVRPFKTGTARIALGAEKHNKTNDLNLKIIPCGVSYNAPNLFRSWVVVEAGKPIVVQDWINEYKGSPENAVDAFTTYLEEKVATLSINARDERGESFINQVETILENSDCLPQKEAYYRSKKVISKHLDNQNLVTEVNAYHITLRHNNLTDIGIVLHQKNYPLLRLIWRFISLIVGLPLAILGNLFWFLPCFIPWFVARKMKLYIGYDSNIKIILGIITIPLMAWFTYKLGLQLFQSPILSMFFVVYLVLLGFFLEYYEQNLRNFQEGIKTFRFAYSQKDAFNTMVEKRARIIKELE